VFLGSVASDEFDGDTVAFQILEDRSRTTSHLKSNAGGKVCAEISSNRACPGTAHPTLCL
jgi:hypothetical protein